MVTSELDEVDDIRRVKSMAVTGLTTICCRLPLILYVKNQILISCFANFDVFTPAIRFKLMSVLSW